MIKVKKVKIYDSWRFKFNVRPSNFRFVVEMEGLNLSGNIEISCIIEQVKVDFNTDISKHITESIVEDEVIRLAILKEIFYRFCVNAKESIGNFIFSYRNEETSKSIIEELLAYEPIIYDKTKQSERVLHSIVKGYSLIKKTNKNNTVATLDDMTKLKSNERRKAFNILKRYLESINDQGVLQFVEVGYDYQMSIIYVSEYKRSSYC